MQIQPKKQYASIAIWEIIITRSSHFPHSGSVMQSGRMRKQHTASTGCTKLGQVSGTLGDKNV